MRVEQKRKKMGGEEHREIRTEGGEMRRKYWSGRKKNDSRDNPPHRHGE